ncbi:MAG: hypothetical protein DRP09_14315 [Candidatus Thorarchaeota archaeon]|nr:MAG: hypothetical protein DRP09_14315 [Candidatus Thorarchaeota archaeon]
MGSLLERKDRAYCSQESLKRYRDLVQKKKIFKTQASLFELCAAIGIRDGERKEFKDRAQLVQSYSIDADDALALAVLEKHPDIAKEDILRVLEEYAEYGMAKLYRWIVDTGPRNVGDLPLINWLKLDLEES